MSPSRYHRVKTWRSSILFAKWMVLERRMEKKIRQTTRGTFLDKIFRKWVFEGWNEEKKYLIEFYYFIIDRDNLFGTSMVSKEVCRCCRYFSVLMITQVRAKRKGLLNRLRTPFWLWRALKKSSEDRFQGQIGWNPWPSLLSPLACVQNDNNWRKTLFFNGRHGQSKFHSR